MHTGLEPLIVVPLLAVALLQLVLPAITATSARHWGFRARAVLSLQVVLASVAPAVLALWVLGPAGASRDAVLAASAAGAAAGHALLWWRYRTLRHVVAQLPTLRDPERRASTWGALAQQLELARPAPHRGARALGLWVSAVQRVAGHLFDLKDFDRCAEALEMLQGLKAGPRLEAIQAALHAAVLAHRGRLGAAAAALRSVPRPSPTALVESWMVATEALVQALERRPDEALQTLAGYRYPANWHLRTRLEARAHACAARSDAEGAHRALLDLERQFGRIGLDCVIEVNGPASELARTFSARGPAYRSPAV